MPLYWATKDGAKFKVLLQFLYKITTKTLHFLIFSSLSVQVQCSISQNRPEAQSISP